MLAVLILVAEVEMDARVPLLERAVVGKSSRKDVVGMLAERRVGLWQMCHQEQCDQAMEACVCFVWFSAYQHIGGGNSKSFLNAIGQLRKGKGVSGAQLLHGCNKR
jgi:hypothetical protein